MSEQVSIKYPRRVILRFFIRMIGRFLMFVLTRTTITGRENLPQNGPVILVGNHIAIVEAIMMVLYVPYPIEMIGTGDIPIDPRFAWMAKLWGFLPVNRGSVDRDEMRAPIDILKQNGVVGIFPEGGIWETSLKKARTGVAWLSYRTETPIIPMGFGGMKGAVGAAFSLKRPHLVMNIGKMMPPVSGNVDGKSRKEALEYSANLVMAQVAALIPEEEKRSWRTVQDERFDFKLSLRYTNDAGMTEEIEKPVKYPQALGKFFHRPVLLDVMARNMHLPVKPLQRLNQEHDPAQLADALDTAKKFLDDHPQFLNYRFGYDEAAGMYNGLVELRDEAREAAKQGQQMVLQPIRRYRKPESDTEIMEIVPGVMHKM
jgi:1-acyl-sn-glycerol-3-phosphate acyltransferase